MKHQVNSKDIVRYYEFLEKKGIKTGLSRTGYDFAYYWHTLARLRKFGEFMRIQENQTFVDIGCGDGWTVFWAASCGASFAIGVDILPDRIKRAVCYSHELGLTQTVDFIVADATYLPFQSRSITCIGSMEVLEHIDNWRKAVEEMKRVSERITITTPSNSNPLWKLARLILFRDRLTYASKMKEVGHQHIFSIFEVMGELGKNSNGRLRVGSVLFVAHPEGLVPKSLSKIFFSKVFEALFWGIAPLDYELCGLYPFKYLGATMVLSLQAIAHPYTSYANHTNSNPYEQS